MATAAPSDHPRPAVGKAAPGNPAAAPRVALLDVARGVALVAMFVYHFTWDLGFFGFIELRASVDPSWRLFAKLIAGSFLVLVGIGLVLAARSGLRPRPYLQRLGGIGLAALAITGATMWWSPDSYIFFGILHCIAASSVLGLLFLRAPAWWTALIAAAAFAAPAFFRSPAFDGPAFWWIGLSTSVPTTDDYEPMLPWFGCVLAGIALARLAVDNGWDRRLAAWSPRDPMTRLLALGGRHSLLLYLIHQPLFIGLLSLAVMAGAPQPALRPIPQESAFVPECARVCVASGVERGYCLATCSCLAERLSGDKDLMSRSMRGPLPPEDDARLRAEAQLCAPVRN
jgi:uncharacterized membrane protein